MALINSDVIPASATGYQINQSLRFESGDTAHLSRTFGTATNSKKWTWSLWAKGFWNSSSNGTFFAAGTPGNNSSAPRSNNWVATNGRFAINENPTGSTWYQLETYNELWRDTSAWYHIVYAYDSTQSTDSNRQKLYINGEQQTLNEGSGTAFVPQNSSGPVNTATTHMIGANVGNTGALYSGYIAEFHFVDGQQLDPTSFGETGDYGEWKPIEYTGTYGNNGFYLDFDGTYYNDKSGNGNHFTANNLSATDVVPDSPTNNFATWNPLNKQNINLLQGNLKVDPTSGIENIGSTMFVNSGKWYWELYPDSTSEGHYVGIATPERKLSENVYSSNSILFNENSGLYTSSAQGVQGGDSWANSSDVVRFKLDLDGQTFGYAVGSGSFTTVTITSYDSHTSGEYWGAWYGNASGSQAMWWNFGQDSSFEGNKTAQGNTDSNGIGDFYYSPPSGYLALCTANLPDPDANPSEFFKAITYTGAGNGTAITGVGFQPDLGWFANRNNDNKPIYDVQRGTNRIYSNLSGAESSGTFVSFDTDGFTVNADGEIGDSGGSYVAWLWKAGGTAVSNTDGTITSQVSANVDAGFSIVKYTGNGVDLAEVGHGLNGAPDWYMVKNLDQADSWRVGAAPHIDRAYSFQLNDTAAASSQDSWGNKVPLADAVRLGQDAATNTSGEEYIMYCFKSTDGVSKAGVYVGNGSSDGVFLYTGFRPAFLFLVVYDEVSGKTIHDIAVNPYNVMDTRLRADNTGGDDVSTNNYLDFLSNGIKFRSTDIGNSVKNWLYLAFAEQPFKYTNAR